MNKWRQRAIYQRRTPHNVKVVSGLGPSKEGSAPRARCELCGLFITYSTIDGALVALDDHSTCLHRHQPSPPDPERNRRMVAAAECVDGYARYQTKSKP